MATGTRAPRPLSELAIVAIRLTTSAARNRVVLEAIQRKGGSFVLALDTHCEVAARGSVSIVRHS